MRKVKRAARRRLLPVLSSWLAPSQARPARCHLKPRSCMQRYQRFVGLRVCAPEGIPGASSLGWFRE